MRTNITFYTLAIVSNTASVFRRMPFFYINPVAERTGKGLQILLRRFESDRGVYFFTIQKAAVEK